MQITNLRRTLFAAALLISVLLALSASQGLRGQIKADGSSTVYPISEAVAEEFGNANPSVKVTIGISGTGGGFKRFCVGETDIQDASRPIKAKEDDTASKNKVLYIELPIAFD